MGTLKIYKTQITPARNALLDDIEKYLLLVEHRPLEYTGEDVMTYSVENFQYVKPDLDITLKVNVDIGNNSIFDAIGNYVRIEQSQGEGPAAIWYYFILNSKWTAQGTLTLECSMDTVNTFSKFLLDKNNWLDKTQIIRQHMDPVEIVYGMGGVPRLVKKIDKHPEDINPVILYKTGDKTIKEAGVGDITKEWYLVYETTNPAFDGVKGEEVSSQNVLSCYVYPAEDTYFKITTSGSARKYSKPVSDFKPLSGDEYCFYGITKGMVEYDGKAGMEYPVGQKDRIVVLDDIDNRGNTVDEFYGEFDMEGYANVGDTFTLEGDTFTCENVGWFTTKYGSSFPMGTFINSSGNKIAAVKIRRFMGITITSGEYYYLTRQEEKDTITFTFHEAKGVLRDTPYTPAAARTVKTEDNPTPTFYFDNTGIIYYKGDTNNLITKFELLHSTEFFNPSSDTGVIYGGLVEGISSLDRTRSTLIKIVALPYCPAPLILDKKEDKTEILIHTGVMELEQSPNNPDKKRIRYKKINNPGGFGSLYLSNHILDFSYTREQAEDIANTKLRKRSMKNEPKLLHSDFYKLKMVYDDKNTTLRMEDIRPDYPLVYLKPRYQPTNTIASTILFKGELKNATYDDITDWDRVIISNRDNEIPIYNNDYINYLRYGYKTESENLRASATSSRINAASNLITGVAAGVLGGATLPGGASVPGMIVGAAIGLIRGAAGIVSSETQIANASRSMEQKLTELQNSAMGITGGGSAVDLMTSYTGNRLHLMTYEMSDLMKNLVYDKLFYYGYSHPEQAVPNLTGRLCFNFVQASPVFKGENTNKYSYYMDDIKERFRIGITVYHNIYEYLLNSDSSQLMYNWNQEFENWYFPVDIDDPEPNKPINPDAPVVPGELNIETSVSGSIDNKDREKITLNFMVNDRNYAPTAEGPYRYVLSYTDKSGSQLYHFYPEELTTNSITFQSGYGPNLNYNDFGDIPSKCMVRVKNILTDKDVVVVGPIEMGRAEHEELAWPLRKDSANTSPWYFRIGTSYNVISPENNFRYQLYMDYDNKFVCYPYSIDNDYDNEFTYFSEFNINSDCLNRGFDPAKVKNVYARIVRVSGNTILRFRDRSQWHCVWSAEE